MNTLKKLSALSLIAPSLLALQACDAETGEAYEGEILLSVEGRVAAGPEVDAESVLALSFHTEEAWYLVDGTTTGQFPSQFRFQVTSPPPPEAFMQKEHMQNPPDADIAQGFLVVVPSEHPPVIPILQGLPDDSGHQGEQTFSTEWNRCTLDGSRCIHDLMECTRYPCQVVSLEGEPSVLASEFGMWTSVDESSMQGDYGFRHACVGNDQGEVSCARELALCELRPEGSYLGLGVSQVGDESTACSLVERSGDAELITALANQGQWVAQNLRIIYASGSVPRDPEQPGSLALSEGYNLVLLPVPELEPQLESLNCLADAEEQAYAEYNADHGTLYVPYSGEEYSEPNAGETIAERLAELREQCPQPPMDEPVLLDAGVGSEIEIVLGQPNP